MLRNLIAGALTLACATAFADDKPLDDPQIATIALTAHQLDVTRGKMAEKKSKNEEVKLFAKQMVDDHTLGQNEVLALAKKLGVKPEASAVSKSLEAGAKETAAKLDKLKGAAFDSAYIDAEIAYHQAVIDAVNKVLLPAVKNPEVKQALENTGPTLVGHLKHAEMVKAQISKK